MSGEQEKALAQIKAVFDDGVAEINGREYTFGKFDHKSRRKVFAFYSKIQPMIKVGDMSFLGWSDWGDIEKVINSHVTLSGMQLSKLDAHWDNHPGDYLKLITISLGVISYPFLDGSS